MSVMPDTAVIEKTGVIRIDADVLREAKIAAAQDRTTVKALTEEAIRDLLAKRKKRPRA